MAVVTNTKVTPASMNREDLSSVVSRITPSDTPIFSMTPKGRCRNTFFEWGIDKLAAPAANALVEGDAYTYEAIVDVVRVGNATQIFGKGITISETQEAVDEAGMVIKMKEQALKKGIEVRKNIEFAFVSNTTGVKTGTRKTASLPAWLTTNDLRNGSGAEGGWNSTTGVADAETTGTLRAFTKTLLDSMMQKIYVAGGTPKFIVVSPYVKSVFVSIMSDSNVSQFRTAVTNSPSGKNTIVATADMYEGPYGMVTIVPNRVMAESAAVARRVFGYDPMYGEVCYLRRMKSVTPAKSHDAYKRFIIAECGLKVKNEAAMGVIADVFGLTAST